MNVNIFGSNKRKTGANNGPDNLFRIGERVYSPNYGSGVVRANNPNGSVIVRFGDKKKSQAVFPTFLDRTAR